MPKTTKKRAQRTAKRTTKTKTTAKRAKRAPSSKKAKPATKRKATVRKAPAKKTASTRRRATAAAKPPKKKELRKGPDTEITPDVLEFIRALDAYKKEKNRPFPTWSEVLEVVRRLGYRKP